MPDLPSDEYDLFAPRLVDLVEMGVSDTAIANYLHMLEVKVIGVPSAVDRTSVARRIRQVATDALKGETR